ncbi:hypothetical protein PYCCODRAFT_1431649 [Trametes coccinea BRFM310]|uniref:Uncharacterized protein n=1 Tax=Trametes coccinea (strain BRFM310) TaxID=1353009 RepID=A0A1Y2J1F2_TRAC3|nr:hypothetical protein PYCCODRAFT_1431649 [Trametes coccinea BRFM310]
MDGDFVQVGPLAPTAEASDLLGLIRPTPPAASEPEAVAPAAQAANVPDVAPQGPETQDGSPDPPHDDPKSKCRCFPHLKMSTMVQGLARLEEVFESLGREYQESLVQIRAMVARLAEAKGTSQTSDSAGNVKVGEDVSSENALLALGTVMTQALSRALKTINSTPGFFIPRSDCKLDIDEHLEVIALHAESLRTARQCLDEAWKGAELMFETRDKLVRAHERMMQRRAMVKAVRSTAIVALPFMPFLSGALSVIEMGLSVFNGVQETYVSDEELLSTTRSVDELRDKLLKAIKKVDEVQVELGPVRARIEEQRANALAPQLLHLRAELQSTEQIVEPVFHRRAAEQRPGEAEKEKAPAGCGTLREALQAMYAIMPILGLSISPDVSLASVSDEAWAQIEADLVKFRASQT